MTIYRGQEGGGRETLNPLEGGLRASGRRHERFGGSLLKVMLYQRSLLKICWRSRSSGVIKLPEPPDGEGGNPYTVFCKDLRPSLDWSPEHGWTVPLSRENDNCWHCARLIQTHTQGRERRNTCVDIKMGSPAKEKPEEAAPDLHENLQSRKYRRPADSPEERQIQRPATMEEAVLSLEEAVNKIKWMKGLLSKGLHWSNAMKESWRISDNTGTSS